MLRHHSQLPHCLGPQLSPAPTLVVGLLASSASEQALELGPELLHRCHPQPPWQTLVGVHFSSEQLVFEEEPWVVNGTQSTMSSRMRQGLLLLPTIQQHLGLLVQPAPA